MEIISVILLIAGCIFILISAIGINRMPDLYMRMSSTTKASTLGISLIALSLILHFLSIDLAFRLILLIFLIFLTAPIAAHQIGRAAYKINVKMWDKSILDEMKDDTEGNNNLKKEQ